MVSPQPILSLKYFQLRKNKLTPGVKKLFYLSWEDALWDLLSKKNIKKGSYILLPDFYCGDVEKNMRIRGYKLARYRIGTDLIADRESFESKIKKYKPAVVIVFHPVGIKSNLLMDRVFIRKVTGDALLIEDSVHMVIDPGEIKILKRNHFIMDSLRKVVPIQGCNIYGKKDDLFFDKPPIRQSYPYSLKVNSLWFLMIVIWTASNYLPDALSKRTAALGEKLMLAGYEVIGDSMNAAGGFWFWKYLSERININKIHRSKKAQVLNYEKALGESLQKGICIHEKDKKNLRGFPLILQNKGAEAILNILRGAGLMLRFELNDTDWAGKRKIIFLPLGVYMSDRQQLEVCKLVEGAILSQQS